MSSAPANEDIQTLQTPPNIAAFSMMDFVSLLIFIALAAAAIWYGWKFGNQYAMAFWTKIQTFGIATGAFLGNVSQRVRTFRRPVAAIPVPP